MAAPKGRTQRDEMGTVLFARVGDDVIARLDAGAAALGITRSAYLERFVREVAVDDDDLPDWVRAEVSERQLPLQVNDPTDRKQNAA